MSDPWAARGAENPWQDARTWSQVAADRNGEKVDAYRERTRTAWSPIRPEDNPWQGGGKARFHHDDDQLTEDPVKRGFTARRRHGWWGRVEYFDSRGRKIS